MAENQKRILEMLAEKKITVEEAEKLMSLAGDREEAARNTSTSLPDVKVPFKYIRVTVEPGPEAEPGKHEKVNVRVPLKLIRAGMKLTSLIPTEAADKMHLAMLEKGIDFDLRNLKPDDIEEFIEALSDLQVNVDGDKETVRVFVE